jgi:hypothetical protein
LPYRNSTESAGTPSSVRWSVPDHVEGDDPHLQPDADGIDAIGVEAGSVEEMAEHRRHSRAALEQDRAGQQHRGKREHGEDRGRQRRYPSDQRDHHQRKQQHEGEQRAARARQEDREQAEPDDQRQQRQGRPAPAPIDARGERDRHQPDRGQQHLGKGNRVGDASRARAGKAKRGEIHALIERDRDGDRRVRRRDQHREVE